MVVVRSTFDAIIPKKQDSYVLQAYKEAVRHFKAIQQQVDTYTISATAQYE